MYSLEIKPRTDAELSILLKQNADIRDSLWEIRRKEIFYNELRGNLKYATIMAILILRPGKTIMNTTISITMRFCVKEAKTDNVCFIVNSAFEM